MAELGAYDIEVQRRLANMVQARAMGGAPVAPTIATPTVTTPSAGTRAWNAIKAPRPMGWGAGARLLGRMSPVALAGTASGVLASKMAGGDVASGADPQLYSRALGEGYANVMPSWMGGLTESERRAGEQFGASNIGESATEIQANRMLGARPSADNTVMQEALAVTQPAATPAVRAPQPVVSPIVSEASVAQVVPFSGAWQNDRPGVVTGAPGMVSTAAPATFATLDRETSAALSAARQANAAAPDNQMFAKNWGALADSYQAGG